MNDLMELPTKTCLTALSQWLTELSCQALPLSPRQLGKRMMSPWLLEQQHWQEIDIQPVISFTNWSYGKYRKHVEEKLQSFLGNDVSKVLDMYNDSLVIGEPFQFAYSSLVSNLRETCPNNVLALNASKGFHSSVYRYVVTNGPSAPINLVGFPAKFACHM